MLQLGRRYGQLRTHIGYVSGNSFFLQCSYAYHDDYQRFLLIYNLDADIHRTNRNFLLTLHVLEDHAYSFQQLNPMDF
jgi:hypothetical protein